MEEEEEGRRRCRKHRPVSQAGEVHSLYLHPILNPNYTTMQMQRRRQRLISPHDRFFSSLNQVERRLSTEKEAIPASTPCTPSSFASPLYLSSIKSFDESSSSSSISSSRSSSAASEFFSIPPPAAVSGESKNDDEIERLMSLLGLSTDGGEDGCSGLGSCHCSGGGFYRRAVGVKGPLCDKEMRRLDGWIEHYRKGERRETARLAHLLLAKAVSLAAISEIDEDDDDDCGLRGLGFPPTVEEFLENDPPSSSSFV